MWRQRLLQVSEPGIGGPAAAGCNTTRDACTAVEGRLRAANGQDSSAVRMPSHGFTCMPLCVCLSARPQVRREDAAAAQGERGGEQQAVACACNVCDMRPGARDQSESRRGRRRPQDTGHLRSRSRQIFVIHFTRLTSPPPLSVPRPLPTSCTRASSACPGERCSACRTREPSCR